MNDGGRTRRPLPVQKARRIQADNQARGQRARTHLERARKRSRSRLQRRARSHRRGRGAGVTSTVRRRLVLACAFAASTLAGALFGGPIVEAVGALGDAGPGRIDTIAVQGNTLLSSRDVAAASGVDPGQIGNSLETERVGERLRAHPWIAEAHVMRLPPGKLLIRIEEREPAALLAPVGAGPSAGWRYVDASGTPFAHSSERGPRALDAGASWPRLRGGEALEDDRAHPELAAALALSRHLRAGRLDTLLGAEGDLEVRLPEPSDPRGWVLEAGPDRPRVILGHERLAERVDRLAWLLQSRVDALRGTTEIDLRFADRAVLRSGEASVPASG